MNCSQPPLGDSDAANRPGKDGKWHDVKIRMKNPDYYARARKEYLDK